MSRNQGRHFFKKQSLLERTCVPLTTERVHKRQRNCQQCGAWLSVSESSAAALRTAKVSFRVYISGTVELDPEHTGGQRQKCYASDKAKNTAYQIRKPVQHTKEKQGNTCFCLETEKTPGHGQTLARKHKSKQNTRHGSRQKQLLVFI